MVDDSPTNLLALESILRAPDRNLIRASSGEDALRYLLDNEAAVVLLDVYMPGIDGLQTAELIRRREKSRDIPIIFLTANTTGQISSEPRVFAGSSRLHRQAGRCGHPEIEGRGLCRALQENA